MNCIQFPVERFWRCFDSYYSLWSDGLAAAGFVQAGFDNPIDMTDVAAAIENTGAGIAVFWPRHYWDWSWRQRPDTDERHMLRNWWPVAEDDSIMRVAIVHDVGDDRHRLDCYRRWHDMIQPHVYVVWYHPDTILEHLPEIRYGKTVRTWHVVDESECPALDAMADRKVGCLSGAINRTHYPLRCQAYLMWKQQRAGECLEYIKHPGYTCLSPRSCEFMSQLAGYKVALCTASRYKRALRKIVEATCAGCRVVTDLPACDVLPEIDRNLVRVPPDISDVNLLERIVGAAKSWSFEEQATVAISCRKRYDCFYEGRRVADVLRMLKEIRDG